MQHQTSITFQKKIASGLETLREASNGLSGDLNASAVEFSDGSIAVFTNGDPEWVTSWAEALNLLEVEK